MPMVGPNQSRPEKVSYVAVILCGEGDAEDGEIVGTARNWVEAEIAVRAAGYTIIREKDGGAWDYYDAEDGPGVQGYEPDGLGVYIITVEA